MKQAPVATTEIGFLSGIAVSEILKRVNKEQLSGALEVTAEGIERTIHFDRGFIVFTASTAPHERLGSACSRAGRITEEGIEIALHALQGRQRIGEAMLEAGLVTQDVLGHELVEQVHKVATAVYG